jgi:hypothetical protein
LATALKSSAAASAERRDGAKRSAVCARRAKADRARRTAKGRRDAETVER